MGTRIQDKSRPTKRPQATVGLDGSPAWDKVRSGKPKIDKKGFPATNGIPYPVSVGGTASYPTPPGGVVKVGGTWLYESFASSDDGHVADDSGGNLTISDADREGTDVSATIGAITAGQTIWMGSPFGTWSAVVSTVTPGSGVTIIAHGTPTVTGGFGFGQIVSFAAGTAAASQFNANNPGAYPVQQVKDWVTANCLNATGDPINAQCLATIQTIIDAERATTNRPTLVAWLDAIQGVV